MSTLAQSLEEQGVILRPLDELRLARLETAKRFAPHVDKAITVLRRIVDGSPLEFDVTRTLPTFAEQIAAVKVVLAYGLGTPSPMPDIELSDEFQGKTKSVKVLVEYK